MITKIQWTDITWNPIDGCSHRSPGCVNCYAEKMAARFAGPGKPYEDVITNGKWNGKVKFHPDRLDAPLRLRKPRRIFVNSMGDLFHPAVSLEQQAAIFGVMAVCPQHTFQVLTKWPERASEFFGYIAARASFVGDEPWWQPWICTAEAQQHIHFGHRATTELARVSWPLSNVHIGVSVEDQTRANQRIPVLLEIPAAVRFISAEPLLGPIRFQDVPGFDKAGSIGQDLLRNVWVIVGGESGHKARQCDVRWVRSLVQQCRQAGVPCFVKQLGSCSGYWYSGGFQYFAVPLPGPNCEALEADGTGFHRYVFLDSKGGNPDEWPEDLRVREFPR